MMLAALLLSVAQATPHMDSIYLIMVDRFANGNPNNDDTINMEDPMAFHGGDLRGIIQHLDDIESLGVDTIWLTPITKMRTEPIGVHGAFHGYWVDNGRTIEPRFGNAEDLIDLKKALRMRGMKLMLDMVLNHMGPETPQTQTNPHWFRTNGDITDWGDDIQRRTHDVHGLPDFDHGHVEVAKHLVGDGLHWVRTVNPDGFRIDAVRHIDQPFLHSWISTMSTAGDLVFAGEVFDGNPVTVAREAAATGLTHTFDFPLHYAITEGFCGPGDLRKIAAVLTQDRNYPDKHQWITFLDNHDTARVRSVCKDKTEAAFALLTSLRGIPAITWGTVSGQDGEAEPENRGDMDFERTPMHKWIVDRLDERRSFTPLTEGQTDIIMAEPERLVFARVMPHEAIVVDIGGSGKLPPLPAEAGTPQSLALEGTGIHRWLVTPKVGEDFTAWAQRLTEEKSATHTIGITTGGGRFVAGGDPSIGAWSVDGAVGPGSVTVALPRGGFVAVKTIKKPEGGQPIWSSHPDEYIDVDAVHASGEPFKLSQ
jgi:glycosidase